ncbi:MAG: hypothetical protein HKN47_28880, partial [Pirellulaceae bacterium]|nr:hypothetical protein [Pirellulaceae bacterium]
AQSGQIPTWYRADSPPEPDGPRIVVVPDPSFDQLPSGFENKCQRNHDCQWIQGADRTQMLAALGLSEPLAELETEHRRIGVEDFFAAGYAVLQVQIMTRRLRYTSNLDEIHLQKQAVQAAKAYLDGDVETAVTALHNVFDCLSEERDHYFSSDPHLIDLTLLTPSTLDQVADVQQFSPATNQEQAARLDTPQNVLIDAEVAQALSAAGDGKYDRFKSMLGDGHVGWAGGAPLGDACMDAMTFGQAESVMNAGHQLATEAIGQPPTVYARFSGSTPSDLTPTLVRLGYVGLIPIDFARGTGFGEEAKVIQQAGGVEIESLTAKPIDAAGDSAFLSLGARLGESIDSGEIATALLAHWPGQGCESFQDLRRVASWCLALGRFWKLHDYFCEGEHPYHHGTTRSVSSDSHESLTSAVHRGDVDPITAGIKSAKNAVQNEAGRLLEGMTALIAARPSNNDRPSDSETNQPVDLQSIELAAQFAKASGAETDDANRSLMVVNPLSVGKRALVTTHSQVSVGPEHIYAVSCTGDRSDVSVDVPASGFAVVQGGDGGGQKQSLFKRFFRPATIADGNTLRNEFMEVSISDETGGIQGVYSGGTRGNRFSMRLVWASPSDDRPKSKKEDSSDGHSSTMTCEKIRVMESSEAVGVIEVSGSVLDPASKSVATYTIEYRLERGSRWVQIAGRVQPTGIFSTDPWKSYLGARVAVASESSIARVIVRDKLHRARSRRLIAPLGLVIDEAERQTQIGAGGLTYHRRVGDRFIDTLLVVKGETKESFSLAYGFDTPNPVGNAKGLICPPTAVSIVSKSSLPPRGWITHVAPAEAMISSLVVHRREDGLLAASVRVIQTRSKSASLAIRFCRDVQFATNLQLGDLQEINQSIPQASDDDADAKQVTGMKWKADTVRFSVSGHQVTDFLVVFQS